MSAGHPAMAIEGTVQPCKMWVVGLGRVLTSLVGFIRMGKLRPVRFLTPVPSVE